MTENEINAALVYLNENMPKWDYEANVYCSETCYGLGEWICSEPEGYVFKTAIEALENAKKYIWHDLRKNPKDLPDECITVEVVLKSDYSDLTQLEHGRYMRIESGTYWLVDHIGWIKHPIYKEGMGGCSIKDVIKWRYVDTFEV